MKHTLKAPGSKRLKLGYEKLLSNFGFNFNLRRYSLGRVERDNLARMGALYQVCLLVPTPSALRNLRFEW